MFVIQVSENLMKGNDDYEMNDGNGMMGKRKYTNAKGMAVERIGERKSFHSLLKGKTYRAQHISIF